ncbi:MAG: PAS domain S-box protein [Isosphaeraceae bacterium]
MKLPLPKPWAHVVVVLGVALATAVRIALNPLLGTDYPFVTYFFLMLLVAWVCGLGPSVSALLLGSLAATFFFPPVVGPGGWVPVAHIVRLVLYLLVGAIVVAMNESERRARRRAEEAWGMLDAMLRSSPVGMALLDREYRYITINDALARLNGLPRSEHIGRPASQVLPTVWPGLESIFRRVFEEGQPVLNHEVSGQSAWRPDGVRTVVTNTYPVRVEGRGIVAVGIAAVDVTESRRLEHALLDSERRLRQIYDQTAVGIVTCRLDGTLTAANPGFREILGYSPEEIPSLTVASITHHDDLQSDLAQAQRSVAGEIDRYTIEKRYLRKDGSPVWVQLTSTTLRGKDGEPEGGLAIVQDISERRVAEERLRQSADDYRALFDSAGVGNAEVRLDSGQFLRVNRKYCEITGFDPVELLGMTLLQLIHPEDRDPDWAAVAESLRNDGAGAAVEKRYVRKDGRTIWVSATRALVRHADGRAWQLLVSAQDITARKEAEQRLRDSEATLRAFYDNSPVCMGVVEPTGDGDVLHLYDNPASCRFFGLEAGSTEGRLASEIGADTRVVATWLDRYRESEQSGQPVRFEHEYEGLDGPRWLSATVSTIGPGPGGRMRFCYVAEDVTERRTLSAELEAGLNLLDALFDATPVGLGLVDAEFRYLRVNQAVADTNGLSVQDHIGRTLAEVLPDLWPSLEPLYCGVLETGTPVRNLEVEGITPGGRGDPQSWLASYFPVRQGGRIAGVGFAIVETTEARKREARLLEAEEQLRERAKVLETVLAATPTPIWLTYDRDCRHVTGNPASFRFLRTPEGAVVSATAPDGLPEGRRFREYRGGRPIDPQDLPLQKAAREGIEITDSELTFVFDDGEVRHVYGNTVPLRDEQGEVVGAIAAFVDITRLKLAEEALRENDRRKDEFLAMLAHELRNPLAPIRNAVSIMAMTEDDRESQAWARDVIDRQVLHLTRLVDDLLDVSRISQGKIKLDRETLPVSSFVASALESSRPIIESRKHHLEISLPDEPLRVEGDPTRLSQVVLNLLNNAAKYTPEGGRIRLSVAREDDLMVLSVRDNGEGIPPEMLPKVFELFTQVNRSIDRSEGGLGIGLTLVRRLVEMHGGSVDARSDGPGKGSEFIIRLPLARSQGLSGGVDGPNGLGHAAPRGHRRRVLVVDDSPDATETLRRLLGRLGHEVQTAGDGIAACQAALAFRPDLVILDLGLPRMDGFEVARRLRAEPSLDGVRLVALSGYGSESDRRKTAEVGFDEHLVKPIDFEALRRILERTGVASC